MQVNHNSLEGSFLLSALTKENCFQNMKEFRSEFGLQEKTNQFLVERIQFKELDNWYFEKESGNLVHNSGKFFKIEGIRGHTNFGNIKTWEQPIINQPEIGILGILTKKFDGVRYFLMQAKMEPGNININQLSPTVQATKSNYTQVHRGKQTLFLEFFLDRTKVKVLVDQLQSEQGARFLRKRNRNMLIEIEEEIDLPDNYYWLTLAQIKQLLTIDNFVNMDARSVLSCIRFVDDRIARTIELNNLRECGSIEIFNQVLTGFAKDIFASIVDKENSLHSKSEIISWFTELKTRYECYVESIPLKDAKHWLRTEKEIVHKSKNFFSVIAVSVRAGNREVQNWTQPMLKQATIGIIGFLTKKIKGVLHFLVQAKVEAGYLDIIEMAPTVSFSNSKAKPPFSEFFINTPREQMKFSVLLSEEGGRFYHSQNRYMAVEIESNRELKIPENYIWLTLGQLLEFIQYNNYVNVEARSLLSCLKFL